LAANRKPAKGPLAAPLILTAGPGRKQLISIGGAVPARAFDVIVPLHDTLTTARMEVERILRTAARIWRMTWPERRLRPRLVMLAGTGHYDRTVDCSEDDATC
jgi:hypothetical protein